MTDPNAAVEKIWLRDYPPGVPAEIDPDRFRSLKHLYEHAFREHAASTAYTNMGRTLTYAEIDEQSRRFGAWLQKVAGLRKGDRVAIMMPNVLQYPVAIAALPPRGLRVVNVNPLYTPRELEHQLQGFGRGRDRDPRELRAHAAAGARAHAGQARRRDGHRRPARISEGRRSRISSMRKVKKTGAGVRAARGRPFQRRARRGRLRSRSTRWRSTGEDIAFLQYTGGTTGVSKGAVLTHRNMVANMLQVGAWFMPELGEVDDPAVITALPLYHIFALTTNMLVFMHVGGNNVLITNPRDMPGFVEGTRAGALHLHHAA